MFCEWPELHVSAAGNGAINTQDAARANQLFHNCFTGVRVTPLEVPTFTLGILLCVWKCVTGRKVNALKPLHTLTFQACSQLIVSKDPVSAADMQAHDSS